MSDTDATTPDARAERRRTQRPRTGSPGVAGLIALVGLVVLVGVVVWLLVRDGGDDTAASNTPVAAATAELEALPAEVGHPVYWAGERPGATYELTRTADDRIYIRYLPKGTAVGDPSPRFTTVATYFQRGAYARVQAAARAPGARSYDTRSGALVVVDPSSPSSVYFAFKGEPYLAEVFDPSPTKALDLALSGKIVRLQPQG